MRPRFFFHPDTRRRYAAPPSHPTRCHRPGRHRLRRPGPGHRVPDQAHQARDCLPGRWPDRHHHARAGRQRQPHPGPAGDRRQQARRRRHIARAGAADGRRRRLHRGADPARCVPPALHHQDQLGPGQGHQLRDQRHRLRVRHRRAGRLAAQDLDALRRLGQGQPGQAQLRLDRHHDQPAPDDRADRAESSASNCCTCPTRAAPT